MRKYLAIVLGVLITLGIAATAYAMDTDITLGGDIMVRGWYVDNVHDGLPTDTDSQAFYTTDANITLDAKVSDNVRGFIQLETTMADYPYSGEYIWATEGGEDYKPDANLHFRQLWIQYTGSGLLGVPAGVKVGHMPLSLGEKQFVNNERFGDDAIVAWVDPTKELHLAVLTAKLNEGYYDKHYDDIDAYVALATYQLDKDNLVGVNYTYIHSDGEITDGIDFSNVGFHANGLVANFTYAAEVDFQFGDIDELHAGADAGGWAVFAKLGYMIDPVNLRASFAYGSGDDDGYTDGDNDEFLTLQGPDYIDPISREVHHTMIYERWIQTAAAQQVLTTSGQNYRNTGIANTTLYNVGVDVTPTNDISLSVDGFYLQASETGCFGPDVPDDLGWEVDFRGTYKIAKNLEYFVEVAGFWPDDFYTDPAIGGTDETITHLVHGLLLTF